MSLSLGQLLEKTKDWDKDERYMATSDLCTELQKDVRIDTNMERRICDAVLLQLDDTSNDVQSIAVKCLGILVKKVQEAQVGAICDKLCALIIEGKAELRDIYSIGLKTLITDVPDSMGPAVAARLTSRLLSGIEQDGVQEIKLECLDIIADLLRRFGHDVEADHENIMKITLKQISDPQNVVRKSATACLGSLAIVISDPLLNTLTETLLGDIEAQKPGQDMGTLIQTIGTISRTVGYRLGRELDRVVPLFLRCCGDPEDEDQQTEQANELRENCLQGFQSFVLRCPREVAPHLGDIVKVCQEFLKYDPNYTYDSEDDAEEDDEEDDMDYSDEDYGDGDDGDDDDTSWKVRRASLHVLSSIVTTRSEMLADLYGTSAPLLIGRFKEREENVRLDVLSCFTELLRASEGTELLADKIPAIVAAATKQLGAKVPVKTRSQVFILLKQLVAVAPFGSLADHVPALIPSITLAMSDPKSSALKLDALVFTRMLMDGSAAAATTAASASVFQPHVPSLVSLVVGCVGEDWYKVVAEALRVVGAIVRVIRPSSGSSGADDGDGDVAMAATMSDDFDVSPFVSELHDAVLPRLQAHDIDQEIKEAAISTMGVVVAHLADHMDAAQLATTVLPLLLEKLRNEITRMPTLKALAAIAASPLTVDLGPILQDTISELAQFLRQQSRSLKQTTLETLVALVRSSGSGMSGDLFSAVLVETGPLVSADDLHLSHLALQLTVTVLGSSAGSAAAPVVASEVLPRALKLASSPLLQGGALSSLLNLFRCLVKSQSGGSSGGLSFDSLLASLIQPVSDGGSALPKQAVANLARCVAVVCISTDPAACTATVQKFVADVQSGGGGSDASMQLALLCLGEIGSQTDLSAAHADLQQVILSAFETGSEETKAGAAYALGHVTVGNMAGYLPTLLDALSPDNKQQLNEYLLLSSLREVIACHAATPGLDFSPYVDGSLPILVQHCQSEEEGVRNMVAECLGKLAIIDPEKLVPKLSDLCSGVGDELKLTRWTAITALKSCLGSDAPALAATLAGHIAVFLGLLSDGDLAVRRAALLSLNSAAHHQPSLLAGHLADKVFPVIYEVAKLKLERTVDLGPFKHKVDDGLPLRKAAFACMDTILGDKLADVVDIPVFLPFLCVGLADHVDVAMLSHQILGKVCAVQPGAVIGALESILEPLAKTVFKKPKGSQVGTELERAKDLIRSGLRGVDAVARVPDVDKDRKFVDFLAKIHRSDQLQMMLETIKNERKAE